MSASPGIDELPLLSLCPSPFMACPQPLPTFTGFLSCPWRRRLYALSRCFLCRSSSCWETSCIDICLWRPCLCSFLCLFLISYRGGICSLVVISLRITWATPMSAQQWETAFRWCAEKFGREWLQPTRPETLVTDAYVVAAIWNAGSRAESLRGADKLMQKLGTSISDVAWPILAELCAVAHFASRGTRVVLEQDIHLEGSRHKPDMHIQLPVDSFHVEISCPEMGQEYLRLMALLRSTVESI